MATGVVRGEILTTSSDSLDPKIGGKCKQRTIIFHRGQVIVNFVRKFVAMAPSDSLGQKIEGKCKEHEIILYVDQVIPL